MSSVLFAGSMEELERGHAQLRTDTEQQVRGICDSAAEQVGQAREDAARDISAAREEAARQVADAEARADHQRLTEQLAQLQAALAEADPEPGDVPTTRPVTTSSTKKTSGTRAIRPEA